MDGVLTDFESHTHKLTKKTADELEKNDSLWDEVQKHGEDFWTNMPWLPGSKKLWEFIKKHKSVFILSAPAKKLPESKTGKIKWVSRELGNVKVILCRAIEKQNYANPKSILIDDLEKNIAQWRSKGGIGILFKNVDQTIRELEKLGIK